MKTLNEILDNYKDYEIFLDDRFGVRLSQFLTKEQLEKIGFKWDSEEPYPEPKEWTRENILAQLRKDVEFGFEKALDQRGISASLMFYVVLRWNQVLEEGLEDYSEDNYPMYGFLYLRLPPKSMVGKILSETIMVTKVITTKNTMKDCAIVIVDALEEYENNLSHKISILESRLHFMEKEREAIIRHLEEGNIDLLKEYFKIGK